MTTWEFWGCSFLAFGPPFAMFVFTVAHDSVRIIIMILSCFFWLVALLLSGLLWFAVVPLREELAFGLIFSVVFQEVSRGLLYLLLVKAEKGLENIGSGPPLLSSEQRHILAYVCGFGFGVMSGLFALVNVLRDMTGPGTVGLFGDSNYFFLVSTFLSLCFVLLHTAWGVIFFDGLFMKKYWQPSLVIVAHLISSSITLLNGLEAPMYGLTISLPYAILLLSSLFAFFLAGGSFPRLIAAMNPSVKGTRLEVNPDSQSSSAASGDRQML